MKMPHSSDVRIPFGGKALFQQVSGRNEFENGLKSSRRELLGENGLVGGNVFIELDEGGEKIQVGICVFVYFCFFIYKFCLEARLSSSWTRAVRKPRLGLIVRAVFT